MGKDAFSTHAALFGTHSLAYENNLSYLARHFLPESELCNFVTNVRNTFEVMTLISCVRVNSS